MNLLKKIVVRRAVAKQFGKHFARKSYGDPLLERINEWWYDCRCDIQKMRKRTKKERKELNEKKLNCAFY